MTNISCSYKIGEPSRLTVTKTGKHIKVWNSRRAWSRWVLENEITDALVEEITKELDNEILELFKSVFSAHLSKCVNIPEHYLHDRG